MLMTSIPSIPGLDPLFADQAARMIATFPLGRAVRMSDSALRPSRDYYLRIGQPTRRSLAEQAYRDKAALRGIITGHAANTQGIPYLLYEMGGLKGQCSPHMLTPA